MAVDRRLQQATRHQNQLVYFCFGQASSRRADQHHCPCGEFGDCLSSDEETLCCYRNCLTSKLNFSSEGRPPTKAVFLFACGEYAQCARFFTESNEK